MKTPNIRRIILLAFFASMSVAASAQAFLQNPKFGPDEETRKNCAVNLSLYREHFNQRNFAAAKGPWLKVLEICPAASQNVYIHGVRMVKEWIEAETNPRRRSNLLDTLFWVYDLRIQHFDRKGFLTGQKGLDLFTYSQDRYEEAYALIAESIELEKANSESSVLYTYMLLNKTMFENRKINAERVIDAYLQISDYLNAQIAAKPDDTKNKEVKETIDELFSTMGVLTCDNLPEIFGPKISANPNNYPLIQRTFTLLTANRCNNTPFYRQLALEVFKNEPTSAIAFELARYFYTQRDLEQTEKFFMEAVKHEQNPERKSAFLVEFAGIVARDLNNPQRARSIALQAIELNPNSGHAFMLIGNLYVAEKNCGPDPFTRSTVFWAAVDKFIRAKAVDPSLAEECDKLIDLYSQYFPAQNEIFFQDLNPGATYLVGCWINERTTVRARP